MSNKSFKDGLQFAWDNTSLTLAMECPRKYAFRMIQNLVPKGTSVHLLFGGLYATALEHYYKYIANGMSKEAALREIIREALISTWAHSKDAMGQRIEGTGQPINFEHAAKTRPNLIRTLVWYIEEFGEETPDGIQTHHLQDGAPAVELSFALDFGDDLLYCGHLDRVVTYGGHLYWMDQKTTGRTITTKFFNDFKLAPQFSGYTWAGQTILKSPVKGGIVDGAQIAVGFSRFERGFSPRSASQLNEWYDYAHQWIALIRRMTYENNFPMNYSSCGNYGGCPYRLLCECSPQVRETYLQSHYAEVSAWDPLEVR